MDAHIRGAVTRGLRARGVDVLTAQEDSERTLDDPEILDRALQLGQVVFTNDTDFLAHAMRRQEAGVPFAGVADAHQLRSNVGRWIADLEIIAKASELSDHMNRVTYLPL